MPKPLTSVVALARFELVGEYLDAAISALAQESDWQEWVNQVELHGLSGIINKHLYDHDLPIPDLVVDALLALKERHILASKMRYQALREIDACFQKHQVDYIALKGSALVPHIYRQGFLRPMRDMDILVRRDDQVIAANALRELGYDLPDTQPSKFMHDMNQLPNATKTIEGLISSIELHLDGISREVKGHLYYPESADSVQRLSWGTISSKALEDILMLHQVSRHLEGLHPNAILKLINVMDVIALANHVQSTGQWNRLVKEYPHVINTLRCLHLLTPLPVNLQQAVELLPCREVKQVGQIMGSLTSIFFVKETLRVRLKRLFLPSDWWMHLHYNVDPNRSLIWVKLIRHPLKVSNWLLRRAYSWVLGG